MRSVHTLASVQAHSEMAPSSWDELDEEGFYEGVGCGVWERLVCGGGG